MITPLVIFILLMVAFVMASGYWMWLVKGLKRRRYRAFVQLLTYLDARCEVVGQLATLVEQQVKSEQAFCQKIKTLCLKTTQEKKKVRKRLSKEVELSKQIMELVKKIQTYVSLRTHTKIMQAEIHLADIEEKIASDMLLFNTLTERYNREVELLAMRPFAAMLKFRKHRHYPVVREE